MCNFLKVHLDKNVGYFLQRRGQNKSTAVVEEPKN